jgi:hypothetical protein
MEQERTLSDSLYLAVPTRCLSVCKPQ